MKIRPAYVAGQFYPSRPETLRADIQRYITEAAMEANPAGTSALIVPHAGYMFSGPTAGYAYARISGATPSRVLLLGVSHRYRFKGLSLFTGKAFETPLGNAPLDQEFIDHVASKCAWSAPQAHEQEHTLEVQVPFIQTVLGNTPLVPILFSTPVDTFHIDFGRQLAAMLAPGDIIIASTDLSHFLAQEQANAIDQHTIDVILSGDTARLVHALHDDRCSMCGGAAVVAAISCADARGATHRRLLDYRTSAWASGDHKRVVGYAAISCEQPTG